ncbi:thiol:disulfide interchange protein TlpA [Oricola thermophila]|uniref:TlpA family protein disulfide reductase n=1 Tax=Oricola thermophila TaxID=2742145 RepID=A0A6N1VLM5_9HYPH|nr:TlpA disulfide reductase family protein [Oricola thermophila]QKV20119.1 TlpA family protein disulfide reductase [Oricola thermophila]
MKEQSPEKEQDGQPPARGLSVGKIVAVAVVLGAAAGAAGIYATGGLSGNGAQAQGGQCEAAASLGQELKPLLTGEIAAMAVRDRPADLSDLSFNDGDGNSVTLADSGGKPRLVNLWATWCAPCRAEMPALDRLQAEKGGDGFEVVAVSVDGGSDQKPRAFFDEIGIRNLGFYHDPSIGAFNTMKKEGLAFGLPVTVLVDGNNCVVANMNGPAEWASEDAYRLIDAVKEKSR